MSAAEEDTELRDLLVQTLEGSGVLNKIKAELRAAVFLALEEQEKVENKAPLVNESLKKFLNTNDGRLVCGLVTEFLQFFNLDFTLAVFQPETSTLNVTQNRQSLARDLGIVEIEGIRDSPLLMDLLKLCRQKDKGSSIADLSSKQAMEAKKKFEFYDKDKTGKISKDELRALFMDLFPHFHRNMLEQYVNDEFKTTDKHFNNRIDFQDFIGMYTRLFLHCRSVVAQDITDIAPAPWRFTDGKASSTQSKIPRCKGLHEHAGGSEKAGEQIFNGISSSLQEEKIGKLPEIATKIGNKLSESNSKSSNHSSVSETKRVSNLNNNLHQANEKSDLGLEEEHNEGDSFFDDPIPEPDKDYGWRKDSSKTTGGFTDLSNALILKGGQNPRSGVSLVKETDSNEEEEDYMDDFNSTNHQSDKSEFSIGEEIEEDFSAEDLNASDHLDDFTQDHSLSHASVRADYLEDVG